VRPWCGMHHLEKAIHATVHGSLPFHSVRLPSRLSPLDGQGGHASV
jgi:hypothetical protein